MQTRLFDPYSAVYRFQVGEPGRAYIPKSGKTLQETIFCYEVRRAINAKNQMSGYVGEVVYRFFIRNGVIIDMRRYYE